MSERRTGADGRNAADRPSPRERVITDVKFDDPIGQVRGRNGEINLTKGVRRPARLFELSRCYV